MMKKMMKKMKQVKPPLGVYIVGLAALALLAATAFAQTPSQGGGVVSDVSTTRSVEHAQTLAYGLGKIFTYFMVMLGPIKLLAPFVKMTRGMDETGCRNLAFKAFGIACLGGLAAAYLGQNILKKWEVSLPALLLAAGLVLLLVALQATLSQYEAATRSADPTQNAPAEPRALSVAFPNIITPFGVAAFILLLAAADTSRDFSIFGVFLAVMVLNLLAMLFARPILKYGAGFLAILGAVLGVLQVALAIQMILLAGRMLGVLPSASF